MTFKAYETSSAQKRLYTINHLQGDSILYNEIRVWSLMGKLDPVRLEHIVKKISNRHETLRTCFVMKDGVVLQKVYDHIEVDFKYTEQQMNGAGTTPGDIEKIIDGFLKPYELGKVPLWKIEMVQLQQKQQLLLFDFHHIIADGTSMDVIMEELIALYLGKELPVPGVQYVDYTTWQNDLLKGEMIKKQEAYWLKVFKDKIPVLDLPTDYPRPLQAEIAGASIEFEMGDALTAAVKQLASQHNTTLYVVMLAVFNVLLSKYSNQEDILVGSPISGRTHREFENIIGMFVNTLVMRNKPTAKRSFRDFLLEVSANALAAFENQDYQFEMLVEKVAPRRQLNRNPLFDVMFVLQNYARPINISQLGNEVGVLTPFHFKSRAAKFDLTLQAYEIDRHILFRLEYKTSLFHRGSIERLIGHFLNIFRRVTGNCQLKLEEIRVISEAEQRHLLHVLNDTSAHYPRDKTIHGLFEEQVNKTPDNIAVVAPVQVEYKSYRTYISYRELNRKSNQLAHWLRAKGIGIDTAAALFMDRSPEMVVAILGILKAGGAYLPIDTDYPEKRVLTILENNRVSYLLTRESDTREISFTALQGIKMNAPQAVQPLITAARQPIKEFDRLPPPDRTLVNYEKYHQHIGIAMARHTVSLQASRGCPYNRAYCHKIWPKKHVTRSAENIFKEIRRLYDAGMKRFVFIDDIFNLDKKNSGRLLEMIAGKIPGVQLFFPNGLRGDILSKEFINLLIAAGTVNVDLALESASPRIQELIGKNLHLEKFHQNVRYIIEKYPQLLLEMELMIGFPTETEKEALMTLDYLKSLQWVHFPNLNILKIYPNTDMYRLALENGVSVESIESSVNLAYHQLPDTLPFSREFTRLYQARFMNEYMLSKERLLSLLPYQLKTLDKTELIQKYDSYFPTDIRHFSDILALGGISREELIEPEPIRTGSMAAPGFVHNLQLSNPPEVNSEKENKQPLRILLLDLSQYFSRYKQGMLYDMVEEPLGLMYLLTYLNHMFGRRLQGKIAKSRIDFDSFDQLKALIDDFSPHVIGMRTLSYYKEFFHKSAALIRGWGVTVPIIAGGPYASSDYRQVLQDVHIDMVVLGEGELTLGHLVKEIMAHDNQLPPAAILQNIPGIAFIKEEDKKKFNQGLREVLFPDQSSRVLEQMPEENPRQINRSNDLLYLISTSGSTGKPKSVMLEHRNLVNLMHFQFTRTNIVFDKVLQFSSIGFDMSANEIFSTLLSGGELYLIDRELRYNIPGLLAFIQQNDIHVLFLTPAFLKFLFDQKDYARQFPKRVRHILASGEQLIVTKRFRQYLLENGIYLHNHYGPAETHVVTTLTMTPTDEISRCPSIGTPISNTRILILDENLRLKPLGVVGEIFITGANVGRGYYKKEDLTAQRYMKNPFVKSEPMYRTGDLGRLNIHGQLEFLGRKDQQVKIRGFRIELEEIEHHLAKVDFIKEAVVLDRTTASGDKYLIAYLVCQSKEEELSELREILSRELPDYMIPSFFEKIEKIPLNSSGKVDRKALQAIEPGESPQIYTTKASNNIEAGLVKIWANVLKKKKKTIPTNQSFFELGGHSLNGAILISKIHQQYNVLLRLAELFKNPTIREQAKIIMAAEKEKFAAVKKTEKKEYYALSSAQKRLFILQQVYKENTGYNITSVITLAGHIQSKSLEDSFKTLIQRHESLRTLFLLVIGEPVQRVHEEVEFEIEYYQVKAEVKVEEIEGTRGLAPLPGELAAHSPQPASDLISSFIRPFDLSRAPLLRVGLIKAEEKKHLLIIDMHHIISDGVSIVIIKNDLTALYSGQALPGLRLDYKDFSEWQNRAFATGENSIKAQEWYWLKKFEDQRPRLNLPLDYPRPTIKEFKGKTVKFTIDKNAASQLHQLTIRRGTTLNMVLLAVYYILLSRYTRQEDIIVGMPITGRRHADLQDIVGMFVNMLPLRNQPRASKTFDSFLREIKQDVLAALKNQDYQFEELVKNLGIERDIAENPLINVVFQMTNIDTGISAAEIIHHPSDLVITPYQLENQGAVFDLILMAQEENGTVQMELVYDAALFQRATAEKMTRRYIDILEQILENPNIKLENIKIAHELKTLKANINQRIREFGF